MFDGVFDTMDAAERKDYFTRICLRELADETVIFTGNERVQARLSDQILVLRDGVIEEQGSIDQLDALGPNSLFDSIINEDAVVKGTSQLTKLIETAQDSAIKHGALSDVDHTASVSNPI